jgi:DNA repair protein RadD
MRNLIQRTNQVKPAALRSYQLDAIDACRDSIRRGHRSICLVSPTGSGKTRMGCEVATRHVAKGGRVLWLAHRAELVRQAAERLEVEGIAKVGIISAVAPNPHPDAPVQVASTQTLLARGTYPEASLLVLDEAHHYVADQWGSLAQRYSQSVRLGLTATPERCDGKPLGDLFEDLVVACSPAALTAQGFLVPCDVFAPPRYCPTKLAGTPVHKYLEHSPDGLALVFAANVQHAEQIAASFNAHGVKASTVTGETPAAERAETIEAFGRGEIRVVTNVAVLTEGTDIPAADTVILARSAGSAGLYLQIVGRILRPAPGKTRATLIDLVGASRKHGLPTDERRYSLEGRHGIRLAKPNGFKGRRRRQMTPKAIEAVLSRVTAGLDGLAKREHLQELFRVASERGYKSGWALHQFKARFGHAPWEAIGG